MKWSYCVDDDDADAHDENGESDELEEASMPSEDTRTQMLRRRRWLLLLQRGIAAIVGLLLPQESMSKSMAGMKPPSWTTMGHLGKREWRADHAPSSPTSASCLLPCDDDDGEEGGRKRGWWKDGSASDEGRTTIKGVNPASRVERAAAKQGSPLPLSMPLYPAQLRRRRGGGTRG